MSSMTDYEENRILDLSLPATGLFVALTSTAPSDASAGTELTGNAYVRKAIAFATPASGGAKANSAEELFAAATGSTWAAILGLELWDAVTAGNRRWWRALSAPEQRTVAVGDQYRIAAGALTFTLS